MGWASIFVNYPTITRGKSSSFFCCHLLSSFCCTNYHYVECLKRNLSQEEVYDLLAESCGCKNLRTLLKRLTDPKVALRGMRYVRLNGEEEVTSNKNIKQHVYKKFGYRFWFIDGNDTRFDVN